jgi:hypothetical protein
LTDVPYCSIVVLHPRAGRGTSVAPSHALNGLAMVSTFVLTFKLDRFLFAYGKLSLSVTVNGAPPEPVAPPYRSPVSAGGISVRFRSGGLVSVCTTVG